MDIPPICADSQSVQGLSRYWGQNRLASESLVSRSIDAKTANLTTDFDSPITFKSNKIQASFSRNRSFAPHGWSENNKIFLNNCRALLTSLIERWRTAQWLSLSLHPERQKPAHGLDTSRKREPSIVVSLSSFRAH
jgi:hypothetical protein